MKKFFKNPYNIALLSGIGLFFVCLIFAQIWEVFTYLSVFVLAILCFYVSFYVAKIFKSQQDTKDEFFETTENKKTTFLMRESKINKKMFIFGFMILGILLLIMFISMLK